MALITSLSLPEAQSLGARFGIEVVEVVPLAAGSVNSNFRLVTRDRASYFGRIYEEQGRSGADAETRLLGELFACGALVIPPLELRDGGSLTSVGSKVFALFPWVDGEWLCLDRIDQDRLFQVGRALGAIHEASRQVTPLSPGRFRPSDMLSRLDQVERDGVGSLGGSIGLIREKYSEHGERRDPELPQGVCHGDLFRDNVLWDGSEIAALLDFESASWESFVYDIAVTALAWCFTDAFVAAYLSALGEGYRSVRSPSRPELLALETEAALACLRFSTTRITDFELRAAPGLAAGRDFRRFLARLQAVEAGALGPLRAALEGKS